MILHLRRLLSVAIFSLLCLVIVFNTSTASAVLAPIVPPAPDDISSLIDNRPFYDPTATACSSSTPPAGTGVVVDATSKGAVQKVIADAQTKYPGIHVEYAFYSSNGALLDSSQVDTTQNYGASITKAILLTMYLNQVGAGTLSGTARTDLSDMIEKSDNQAADRVYSRITGTPQSISTYAKNTLGMTGFQIDTSDNLYILGQSKITADDFARFFSKIDQYIPNTGDAGTVGTKQHATMRDFGLDLLSHITQQVGLLQSGLPQTVYSKEGWKSEPTGAVGAPYVVNQAAQFTDGTATYGVAVTVGGIKDPQDLNKDQADGEQIIKDIVSALVQPGASTTQSQGSSCCSSNSSGSSIGSPTTNGGTTKGGFTIDQVRTFASEPITSTWNISNSTVEQWFLKQAGAKPTIGKYGLNSSNIGAITSAVQAANVSPVFFYLYTVNEGGGAGGFINHYAGDIPGGGPANAKRDADYLASQSKDKSAGPATGGGEPASLPTAEAKQILDALPLGSIGVVYIQATSAVTAELEDLSGKTGGWTGLFNRPLSDSMQNIKTMGGDPLQGGSTISGGSCATLTSVTGVGMQKGINFAIFIANNDGYGYDQTDRASGWAKYQSNPSCTFPSQCGSFDCSSFISAILTEAGYFKTNPEFATGTEAAALTSVGFTKVFDSVTSSAGLHPGDILVWDGHTEMYIGMYNKVDSAVAAHENENGGIVGGKVGDQTKREINIEEFKASLSSDPWIGVYRAVTAPLI
jgi:PlyCA-like lysin